MYANRYGKTGINPGALTVAIGLNAALLAALIFAAPEVTKRIETVIEGRNIPITDPPPPEPLPKPKIKPQPDQKVILQAPPERPFIPDPVMPRTSDEGTLVGGPPLDGGVLTGGGTGTVIEPVHIPVLTGIELDKRYAGLFQPTYPGSERRAGNEGRVVVRVLVGTDGRVKQVERVSAASDAFYEATERQALGKWRFKPATKDGVPQEAWRTMAVSFVLNEDG